MTASASIPPTPQPTTPSPLIMVVWLSVPTSVSGKATGPSASLRSTYALGQQLEIHLVDDSYTGGHDAEIVKCPLTPPQELISLAVALELQLDIGLQGIG